VDVALLIVVTESIRESKKEARILVGFLGVTGAGKSSLINGLLEAIDCLPADDEKACTAVCVEIAWNGIDDPERTYRAKIDRISLEDWQAELEKLFQDISDEALNKDGENGEMDLERDMRIQGAFQKLKCVYPHIRTQKDLVTYTVHNLLDHPNVKNILGKSKIIESSNLEDFSAAIKPYINSSNSKEDGGESFAHWPLVKVVQLYMKSRILKDGIMLVDLPGSMDTNAARGAIAENYHKNLSLTCVVAPTARASSDKPAQDLLGKVHQRTLQLDNHFSSEHLCFIVSKTDSSLTVDRYIKTHPNVAADLAPVLEKERELISMLDQAQKYCSEQKEAEAKHQQVFAELKNEVTKLQASGKKSKKPQQKRKRDSENGSSKSNVLCKFLID
jgi:hypothetical protein